MKPKINETSFGSITVSGKKYEHDVIIRLDGTIRKRKKKLSKAVYGTSHKVSLEEAKYIHEKGADQLIIGAGQYGALNLSHEAGDFFKKKKCDIKILSTPEAIEKWNNSKGNVIGMFHITC